MKIELRSVSKSIGGRSILSCADLSVASGERVALLGASGSGKTTILRLIAGLTPPDAGEIYLDGHLVSEANRTIVPSELREVGFVFQDGALWPHMTVRGNLEFGLRAHGVPKSERESRIKAVLIELGIPELSSRKPGSLSGGQQQRVALGRALVLRPRIMLMDEPLTGLPKEMRDISLGLILRSHEQQAFTLVCVTHSHEEAEALGQQLFQLEEGRICASDSGGDRA